MFRSDDTDWDNSSRWLRRWYDRVWRFAGTNDRQSFRRAAERIRALGRSGRPFFAAIVSADNHTPFNSREPGFDIAGHGTPAERILNTTHYTDRAVGEPDSFERRVVCPGEEVVAHERARLSALVVEHPKHLVGLDDVRQAVLGPADLAQLYALVAPNYAAVIESYLRAQQAARAEDEDQRDLSERPPFAAQPESAIG